MMISIEQIIGELLSAKANIPQLSAQLQRESNKINSSMSNAQGTFGDQQAGQELVATLYKTLQGIFYAQSSLHTAEQEIQRCIMYMKK